LGIPWIIVGDGDEKGVDNLTKVTNYVKNDRMSKNNLPQNDIIQLVENDIEVLLCMSGFGHVYFAEYHRRNLTYGGKYINKTWEEIKGQCTTQAQLMSKAIELTKARTSKVSKPMMAEKVAEEISIKGRESIPTTLQEIISTAVRFSGGNIQ